MQHIPSSRKQAHAWQNRCGWLLTATIIQPVLATSGATCDNSMPRTFKPRVLLQRGFAPALPQFPGAGQKVIAAAGYDLLSSMSSDLGFSAAKQPEGELSRSNKVVFVSASMLILFAVGMYIKWLISDYEEQAHVGSPPWYVDTKMLLKISCTTLLSWLSIGVVAFTQVILFNDPPRHLSMIESFYLSSQIVTTVGYGDLTPSKPEGQVFLACYILLGVTLVAIVGSVGVSEMLNKTMSTHPDISGDARPSPERTDDGNESEESGNLQKSARPSRLTLSTQLAHRPRWVVARSIIYYILSVAAGTIFFHMYPGEDKTIWQAFYMASITLSSVGFGAIHPVTEGGRLFATIWMLIGVGCTANMICSIGEWLLKRHREVEGAFLKEDLLKEMDEDGSGKVDKIEFLKYQLVRKGFCKKHDIDAALALFEVLDCDGSGDLDIDDLKQFEAHPET